MNKISILSGIIIIIFVSSCSWFSKSTTTDASNDTLEVVSESERYAITPTMVLLDSVRSLKEKPEFISYHFKGNFKSDNSEMPMNGICTIKRDSVIWLSARPGLGIEIGRVYFLKDSLHILDRIQSNYYAHSYADISKMFKQNLSYNHFQALFAAELLSLNKPGVPLGYGYSHNADDKRIEIYRDIPKRLKHKQVLFSTGQLQENTVLDKYGKLIFKAQYAYETPEVTEFPKKITAEFPTAGNLNIKLTIFKYSTESKSVPALKVPGYYTRKYLKFE
jgi:hypothetical protein